MYNCTKCIFKANKTLDILGRFITGTSIDNENYLCKFFNKIENSHNFHTFTITCLKMIYLVGCVSIINFILVNLKFEYKILH